MFQLLIDTCVWIDIAKDRHQEPLLTALEELVKAKRVALILPRTIIEEFARNKARIVKESTQSISATLKRARELVDRLGDSRHKRTALAELTEIDHRLPTLGDSVVESVIRIEQLFKHSAIIEIDDQVKLRAAQRGIDKRAPFHRQRNGIDDAILIEVYRSIVEEPPTKGVRFAFVTHNKSDFSQPSGDSRTPHPEIAGYFSRIRSLYVTTLGELLRRIEPRLVSEITMEREWHEESRRVSEIVAAIGGLVDKVWYNRHMGLRYDLRRGKIKVIERSEWKTKNNQRTIVRDILKGALKAAERVEKRYGKAELGPWTDFEWGMLNGKLSALRWVLGDEWDMLDT